MLSRLLASMALALACAADCRAEPAARQLPEEFVTAPVAQHLRINGLNIEISTVTSTFAPDRACALLSRHWGLSRNGSPLDCRRAGAWLLLTRRVGRREQTMQLLAASVGAAGYLSELDLGARLRESPTPLLPLPSGARVLSALQSSEPDVEIAQFTVGLPLSPAETLHRLSSGAVTRGWSTLKPSDAAADSKVLDFRHGSNEVRAIVVPVGGGSGVVLIEHRAVPRQP